MCFTQPYGSSVQGQNSRTVSGNLWRVKDIVVAPDSFCKLCVCVFACVWPESCSTVGKLNLKTRSLNPPPTCVCVCVCGNAHVYSMHSCKLPHIHLLHSSSSCSRALTAVFHSMSWTAQILRSITLCSQHAVKIRKKKQWFFSSRLGYYAVDTAVQRRLGGGDG